MNYAEDRLDRPSHTPGIPSSCNGGVIPMLRVGDLGAALYNAALQVLSLVAVVGIEEDRKDKEEEEGSLADLDHAVGDLVQVLDFCSMQEVGVKLLLSIYDCCYCQLRDDDDDDEGSSRPAAVEGSAKRELVRSAILSTFVVPSFALEKNDAALPASPSLPRPALPPALHLLLVKLLFTTPKAGWYLSKCCEMILSLPPSVSSCGWGADKIFAYRCAASSSLRTALISSSSSSRVPPPPFVAVLPRQMATLYKSHWAYYKFVVALIAGERTKPGKKGKGRLHVPRPLSSLLFPLPLSVSSGPSSTVAEERAGGGDRGSAPAPHPTRKCDCCSSPPVDGMDLPLDLCRLCFGRASPPMPGDDASSDTIEEPPTVNPDHVSHSCFGLPHEALYFVGDSHCLSLAYQTLEFNRGGGSALLPMIIRCCVPLPATGLKADHVRKPENVLLSSSSSSSSSSSFFTVRNLHRNLRRLPPSVSTVCFTAGEIDCREGIFGDLAASEEESGGAVRREYEELLAKAGQESGAAGDAAAAVGGTTTALQRAVKERAVNFLQGLAHLRRQVVEERPRGRGMQILVMPVVPPARRSKKQGKTMARDVKRETVQIFNAALKDIVRDSSGFCEADRSDGSGGIYFLDYYEHLLEEKPLQDDDEIGARAGGAPPQMKALRAEFNADYTHANSGFRHFFVDAVENSGCNLQWL